MGEDEEDSGDERASNSTQVECTEAARRRRCHSIRAGTGEVTVGGVADIVQIFFEEPK